VLLALLAGAAGMCAETRAQSGSEPASTESVKVQTVSGPKKPARKPDQVLTDDSVALLAVKRAPTETESVAAGAPVSETAGKPEEAAAEDTEKKAAELASLEKQIQEKTKRIALLMRLFVNDERPFLNDPGNPKGDDAAQERRKYEQDELLWETAELAKLKTRLNALTAAK
jgi:hypothetical protein